MVKRRDSKSRRSARMRGFDPHPLRLIISEDTTHEFFRKFQNRDMIYMKIRYTRVRDLV